MESPRNLAKAVLALFLAVAGVMANDYQGYSKMLVGTGITAESGFYRGVQSFEVIDLTPLTTNGGMEAIECDPIPDMLEPISNAMGANWAGNPYICGGLSGLRQLYHCYVYDEDTLAWSQVPLSEMSMIGAPRFNGVGWVAERENWFIHGGVSGQNISERELTLDRGQTTFREYRIETGLDQDYPLTGQGMIRIKIPVDEPGQADVIRYYIAGGQNMEGTQFYNQTWLLDYLVKGQYSKQADMSSARSGAFYGMSYSWMPKDPDDYEDGEEIVEELEESLVMAGGYNDVDGYMDTSEVYSPAQDTWRNGSSLPHKIRGGMSVQLNHTFVAVGGVMDDGNFSDSIYVWDPIELTWSDAADYGVAKLSVGRAYGVAFLVSDNTAGCIRPTTTSTTTSTTTVTDTTVPDTTVPDTPDGE